MKFVRSPFLQNTSSGCFWKIYVARPEKGGYQLELKYMQLYEAEVPSSAGLECLQLYLKNFNVWLPLITL